jgi:hypothetical protein
MTKSKKQVANFSVSYRLIWSYFECLSIRTFAPVLCHLWCDRCYSHRSLPLLPLSFMSSAPILPDLDPRLEILTQGNDHRGYRYFVDLVLCSESPKKILDVHLSFPPGGPRPSSTSSLNYRVMQGHGDCVTAELWDYQPGMFHSRPADGLGLLVKEVENPDTVSNAVSYSVDLCCARSNVG